MSTSDRGGGAPQDDRVWTEPLLVSPHAAPDKAQRVRRMFDAIAPRYELVNRVFSAGRDRAWRRRAVALARVGPNDDVLDIACGTGDFARAFARLLPRRVVGSDFSHQMLRGAYQGAGRCIEWCEADATRLPFESGSFSVVSCAFGVRNLARLDLGLAEMARVLAVGGRAVILEFSRPSHPWARRLYEFYSNRVMPAGAAWLSGDKTGAYHYLPRSITSFLDAAQMVERMKSAGFAEVRVKPMTFGVVTLYIARRGARE